MIRVREAREEDVGQIREIFLAVYGADCHPIARSRDLDADPACIGLPGSPTQVMRVFPPQARGEKALLTGSIDEQIDQLVAKLAPYL